MSGICMRKVAVVFIAALFLNMFCASQFAGCPMHQSKGKAERYNVVRSGMYQLLWEIPQKMVHVNSDFNIYFILKDSLGNKIGDDGSGRFYVRQSINSEDEGKVWISLWNGDAHRYEVSGDLSKPGNRELSVEFYGNDSLQVKSRISVTVMAEMDHGNNGHGDHNDGGMQGHGGGGCH